MRIVVFGSFAESLINFRGPLLRAMVEKGHTVFALAPDAPPDVLGKLSAMGVQYRNISLDRTGFNPFSDARTFLNLIGIFLELRPDVLLSYTIKPVIYGSLAARLTGVKAIYSMITGLGYAFSSTNSERRWVARLAGFLYRLALKGCKCVLFQNTDDRDFFVKSRVLPDIDRTVLINGSGVDLQHFGFVQAPTGAPTFLLVARLIRDKGILEYVEAARLVKRRNPEVEFRLLGPLDTNPTAISAKQVDMWESEGTIKYMGATSDVRPAIADCSVFVLPSYTEGMPRTVLEALSMGRAVITTDVPGCRETVKEGVNGFLVPAQDAPALARAMMRFIGDTELIPHMGKAGRVLAEEKFDVHKVNSVILAAMEL